MRILFCTPPKSLTIERAFKNNKVSFWSYSVRLKMFICVNIGIHHFAFVFKQKSRSRSIVNWIDRLLKVGEDCRRIALPRLLFR